MVLRVTQDKENGNYVGKLRMDKKPEPDDRKVSGLL